MLLLQALNVCMEAQNLLPVVLVQRAHLLQQLKTGLVRGEALRLQLDHVVRAGLQLSLQLFFLVEQGPVLTLKLVDFLH